MRENREDGREMERERERENVEMENLRVQFEELLLLLYTMHIGYK